MADVNAKTEPDAQPEPVRKHERRDQDQRVADRITDVLTMVNVAQMDTELMTLLAPRGYDAAKMAEGLSKQQAAQSAFSARQRAIAAQKQATRKIAEAIAAARQVYTDFRDTARGIFKEPEAKNALGLAGKVPDDVQKFITAARSGYEGALAMPAYLAELARFGFPEAAIKSALGTLDAVVAADTEQEAAKGAAAGATQARDEAVAELDAWVSQFRAIAKVATRSRPDLAKKLGI